MKNARPLVSFTFDDFPRSALFTGGEILRKWGVAGTYYVSFGLEGKLSETGQIFLGPDLSTLIAQGHEIGCHTFAHCDAGETRPAEYERSVIANQHLLQRFSPHLQFQTHSYPIATPNYGVKRRASRHFLGCRGGGQTFNAGKVDLNFLRAFFLEQSRDRPEEIRRVIAANSRAKGWLIFATHDVSEKPTRYGCLPGFFERVVRGCLEAGARILPVAKALETILEPSLLKAGKLQTESRP